MQLPRLRILPLALLLAACDSPTGGGGPPGAASVAIEPDSVRLAWGTSTRLRVTARDSRGRPADLPGAAAWSTSDTLVAVVSDSGTVTARGAGAATVTAVVDGRTAAARVVVPAAYSLAVLEAPADRGAYGMAINDAGQVAGYALKRGTYTSEALLWDAAGRMTVLGEGKASDINGRGQVVGTSPGPGTPNTATHWSGGTRTLLVLGNPLVPGGNTWADAINDAGDVVVTWRPVIGGSGGRSPGMVFLHRGGTLREVASGTNAEGTAINQAGWITLTVGSLAHQTLEGFLWRDGQATSVGGGVTSARDVNAAGDVVGGAYRAYRWTNGVMTFGIPADSAGRIPGMSGAEGINGRGDVVGWFTGRGAFVWRGGALALLDRLLPPGDWLFEVATDVNDRGQVVGYGKHRVTGEVRALRADPVE